LAIRKKGGQGGVKVLLANPNIGGIKKTGQKRENGPKEEKREKNALGTLSNGRKGVVYLSPHS